MQTRDYGSEMWVGEEIGKEEGKAAERGISVNK